MEPTLFWTLIKIVSSCFMFSLGLLIFLGVLKFIGIQTVIMFRRKYYLKLREEEPDSSKLVRIYRFKKGGRGFDVKWKLSDSEIDSIRQLFSWKYYFPKSRSGDDYEI